MIEQKTNYAYKLKYIENLTFDKVRDLTKHFINDLHKKLVDELYQNLERGVIQIDSEPQMLVYLYSFGKMHQAKLNVAFENIPPIFFEQPEINIIDYGCGQAIGTMCYADFLSQKGITQKIKKVTLIEPSEICLKRAALHTSTFFPDAEIITTNKEFDYLSDGDIVCEEDTPTLHILSNVLDLEFDLGNFAQVISDNLKGYNQFACVGPFFNMPPIDRLMDDFAGFFYEAKDNFNKIFDKYQLYPDKSWTAHIRCFSIGELEENLSTEVTEEDIKNGVEDEFGVVYSRDGKRLLKCNKEVETYIIKTNTRVICDRAFIVLHNLSDYDLEDFRNRSFFKQITIPNSVTTIGEEAFQFCISLQKINIPNSVKSIGKHAFLKCKSLQQITIPYSVTSIGEGAFNNCVSLNLIIDSNSFVVKDKMLIDNNENILISYFGANNIIIIPNSVKSIGKNAFFYCESLQQIIIPDSITHIGISAFGCCYSLQQITIQISVTSIGENGFCGCVSLQQITILNPETSIGKNAFYGCEALKQIIIPEGSKEHFKQMLPEKLWDKLYYLKKAIEAPNN